MNKTLVGFIFLLAVMAAKPVSAKLSLWDAFRMRFDVFVEKEDIFYDEVPVKILQDTSSPLFIKSATVKDKGTSMLKIKGLEQTFTSKVENISGKKILTYQLVWQRHIPFADYAEHDFRLNGTEPVGIDDENELEFHRPIHHRSDAYYQIYVAKVLFEDGSEWAAENDMDLGRYWAAIKEEIDAVDDNAQPEFDLDAIK